jgi:hypothetical protein
MSATETDPQAAWAEVTSRWEDEKAHQEYLDRLWDLEGLAEAGRRYKAALDARPGDPVALRWRDEVVKRATALALAQLPRTRPPRTLSPGVRRLLVALALALGISAVAWVLLRWPRSGVAL